MKATRSFGHFLLKKLTQLDELDEPLEAKFDKLFRLFAYTIQEIIRKENIHLSSLFTKIAYLGNRKKLPKLLIYHMHGFRKYNESSEKASYSKSDYLLYRKTVEIAVHKLFSIPSDAAIEKEYRKTYHVKRQDNFKEYIPFLHVLVLSIDIDSKTMKAISAQAPYEEMTISWDKMESNDMYSDSILTLYKSDYLPIPMCIHQVQVTDSGEYIPAIFVFEPSFLIDVTTISNCFHPHGSESQDQFLRKYMMVYPSAAIMKGNIANFFLDELVHNPSLSFQDVKKKLFTINPIALSQFDDRTIKDLIAELEKQFHNIKKTIEIEFTKNNIKKEHIYIEPAFYSPKYGIQGRLDLLHINKKSKQASIVELKGGKPYRANKYGLNNSHYHQTLLYDLLIHSSFGEKLRLNNFILYSGVDEQHLRYAPNISQQQKEAIGVRNKLLVQQLQLENRQENAKLFDSLNVKAFPKIKGFAKSDITHFQDVYQSLDDIEKSYFSHFSGFIAREQRLSKIGVRDQDRLNGLSSIWQNSIDEKVEAFNILNHLELQKNDSDDEKPFLLFKKTTKTAVISNFRVGDILVLYPDINGKQDAALYNQIIKGTLLEMDDQIIRVKLRSRQHNHEIFRLHPVWHIEHDRLDNGFHSMYRSLFEFIESDKLTKDLWLGRRSPGNHKNLELEGFEDLTDQQHEIFEEIIAAKDYYLLWGPPGTGKTSFMIRRVVQYLYTKTSETILLLAYTNKAVDEICGAICAISNDYKNKFIRVGSRYSVDPKYKPNLLIEIADKMERRSEMVTRLQQTRLVVGTVASIVGKPELFSLIKFDRVIIDEASQLLEPTILGILSRFKKVILIGDHYQLPAVVQQSQEETQIEDESLQHLGFTNMSNSLFERLYLTCVKHDWYWAIGQLNAQGRMHQDIMQFPNEHFYKKELKCLPEIERLHKSLPNSKSTEENSIANERLVYVPCSVTEEDMNFKMNSDEASKIPIIVKEIQDRNQSVNQKQSIGVITPYRAQIANIREHMLAAKVDLTEITIDTVERYQGGAKDVIIISLCLNHSIQLRNLSVLSSEGIDRKLNVALTRAREQIILLGNQELLELNPLYKALIESYTTVELTQ
jgi:DNA replication ATP-dependent helicase Dna2